MPINDINWHPITSAEHPIWSGYQAAVKGFGQGQDAIAKLLEQQKNQALLPFVAPKLKRN